MVAVGAFAPHTCVDVPQHPATTSPRKDTSLEQRTLRFSAETRLFHPTHSRMNRPPGDPPPYLVSTYHVCTISTLGLWNATANYEGYDQQRCDTNTLPTSTRSSPQTLSTAVASVWLWNHLHLLTLLWEPTCTAGTGLDDAKRLQGGCLPSRRGRAVRCHHRRHRGHAALRRRRAAGASVAGAEEEVL